MSSTSADLIQRLQAARNRPPSLDKRAVEAALQRHLQALGLPPLPIHWADDAIAGYRRAAQLPVNKAYSQTFDNGHTSDCKPIAWHDEDEIALTAAEQIVRVPLPLVPRRFPITDEVIKELQQHRRVYEKLGVIIREYVHRVALVVECGLSRAPLTKPFWEPLVEAFEAGLWVYWVMRREIVAVPRPLFHMQNGRLHCETGPAVEWLGGDGLWYYRGILVTEQIIMRPETMSLQQILSERNLEIQRIMIERFGGLAKVMREARARVVHRSPQGTLYRLVQPDREPLVVLEVTCPSTGRKYMLRVPPWTPTVREAIAWTFDIPASAYNPVLET